MYIEERGWVNAQNTFGQLLYIEKFGLVGITYKYTKFSFSFGVVLEEEQPYIT